MPSSKVIYAPGSQCGKTLLNYRPTQHFRNFGQNIVADAEKYNAFFGKTQASG
jgi:hypothetical protein